MQTPSVYPKFAVMLGAAAAFVAATSRMLPPLVASHFDAAGRANGFMPRTGYTIFMLAMTVALPAFLALCLEMTRRIPPRLINLPHRDYWLAPERSDESLDYLRTHSLRFAGLLAAFLCVVHWLVVAANLEVPPLLPTATMVAALVLFGAATIVWTGAFFVHFRRPA